MSPSIRTAAQGSTSFTQDLISRTGGLSSKQNKLRQNKISGSYLETRSTSVQSPATPVQRKQQSVSSSFRSLQKTTQLNKSARSGNQFQAASLTTGGIARNRFSITAIKNNISAGIQTRTGTGISRLSEQSRSIRQQDVQSLYQRKNGLQKTGIPAAAGSRAIDLTV